MNDYLKPQSLFITAGLAATLCLSTMPVFAQSARDLDDRLRRLERAVVTLQGQSASAVPGEGAAGNDLAGLSVRILKLEQLVEQLTGQIEETRYASGQTTARVEQLSDDVTYRLTVLEQTLGVSGAVAAPAAGTAAMPAQTASQVPSAAVSAQPQTALRPTSIPSTGATRNPAIPEVIDPDAPMSQPVARQPQVGSPLPSQAAVTAPGPVSAQPGTNAPGGFGQLRVDAQGRALPADPNQMSAPLVSNAPPAVAPAPVAAPNPAAVAGSQLAIAGGGPVDVILPEGTPKQQYDYAFDFLKRQDFARAESAFREFMKRFPNDPLAGNAQYWLGETYYVRGDYQKSVIEFMNGYQNYPKSNKGPDNLLKLGMALANLGQNKEACTALSRMTREYPDVNDQIRRNAQQEIQKLKCG